MCLAAVAATRSNKCSRRSTSDRQYEPLTAGQFAEIGGGHQAIKKAQKIGRTRTRNANARLSKLNGGYLAFSGQKAMQGPRRDDPLLRSTTMQHLVCIFTFVLNERAEGRIDW